MLLFQNPGRHCKRVGLHKLVIVFSASECHLLIKSAYIPEIELHLLLLETFSRFLTVDCKDQDALLSSATLCTFASLESVVV